MNKSNLPEQRVRPDTAESVPGRRGIVWLADGFGFDAASGEWFTANATALAALDWHGAGLQRSQIVGRMTEQFEVSAATAERDLETFFAALPEAFGLRSSN